MDAHCLKEKFFTVLRSSAEQAETMLSEWIHIAEISSLEDFRYCARTLKSWFDGIISSFAYSYTNGFKSDKGSKFKPGEAFDVLSNLKVYDEIAKKCISEPFSKISKLAEAGKRWKKEEISLQNCLL